MDLRNLSYDVSLICSDLKKKLSEAGLWKTFHKVDAVTEALGWEIAEKIGKENRDG